MQNEVQLIDSLKEGNSEALRAIMLKYQDYVYTILINMLGNREESEEAAQDTFVKVFKSISSFNAQSKFSTWLYRIAYRTGLDYIKKRKPVSSLNDQLIPEKFIAVAERVSVKLERDEKFNRLKEALGELKEESATLLRLFYFSEMNLKEVGEITGLHESNVKVKLFRARKQLKELLIKDKTEIFDPYIQ